MKCDEIFAALAMLEKERGIPQDFMMNKIVQALTTAYKRDHADVENVIVDVDEAHQNLKMFVQKNVVEEEDYVDPANEMPIEEAKRLSAKYEVGDIVNIPVDTVEFGRIAAGNGKQVIIQGLREAERGQVYDEFNSKQHEILTGVVTEVIKGGVLVLTNGVKVFIPASQTGVPRDGDLNTLLRKEVSFKILETNRQRRRAVGSISVVAREARKELAQKFWDEVEVGKVYTGKVKSLTNFGAFVDLGGVDGRIGLTDLTWLRVKSPAEVVSIGDTVEVTVKDIDRENNRVSLIYKKTEDNPWEKIKTMYQVGDVVPVKIMSLTTFGAFAQIIPGIDGLIHISQIARERVEKVADKLSVGQVVDAKITELDYDRHRASLSIKALLTEEAPEEEAAEEETPAEE